MLANVTTRSPLSHQRFHSQRRKPEDILLRQPLCTRQHTSGAFCSPKSRVARLHQCRAAEDSGSGGPGDGDVPKKPVGGEGDDGHHSTPNPMQPWAYIYAALLAVGGLMGFLKAKSGKSLGAGLSASLLMAVCAYQMGGPAAGSAAAIACVISAAMTLVMGMRFYKTKKMMPAGVTGLVSAGTTIGFLVTGF